MSSYVGSGIVFKPHSPLGACLHAREQATTLMFWLSAGQWRESELRRTGSDSLGTLNFTLSEFCMFRVNCELCT